MPIDSGAQIAGGPDRTAVGSSDAVPLSNSCHVAAEARLDSGNGQAAVCGGRADPGESVITLDGPTKFWARPCA